MSECEFFWGSHGCDLPDSDHHVHVCGVGDPAGMCCEYDTQRPPEARVRHNFADYTDRDYESESPAPEPVWGEWGPYGDGFWWSEKKKGFVEGNRKPPA